MPYPSTVDTGQVQPWGLYAGEPYAGSAGALGSNTAYLVGVTLYSYAVLTGFRVAFGTAGNGNYDVGIYDSSGNLLAHSGAVLTVTGAQTQTLSTSLSLAPGKYWLALWIASNTDTVVARGGTAATDIVQKITSVSNNLPSTNAGATNTGVTQMPSIIGLLSGGWS